MTNNKMLIDATHQEETRVAVIRGNKLDEFDFESEHKTLLKGNIYLAKITRVEPSLQAAFIDYGGNRHGFLAFSEIHPDYYQIPVADKQILLQEQERAAKQKQAEENELDNKENIIDLYDENDKGEIEEIDDFTPNGTNEIEIDETEKSETEINADKEDDDTLTQDIKTSKTTQRRKRTTRTKKPDAENETEEKIDEENSDAENDAIEADTTNADNKKRGRKNRKTIRDYKIQEVIKRRQILLVQVVKEERGNKGAALTTYISLAGRYCVLMPNTARGGGISRKIMQSNDRNRLKDIATSLKVPQGMGVIVRTSAAQKTEKEIIRDFEYVSELWEKVRAKTLDSIAPSLIYEEASLIKRSIRDLYGKNTGSLIVAGTRGHVEAKNFMSALIPEQVKNLKLYKGKIPLFTKMGVEEQLEQILQPQVTLKSGGYLVINQTEALVAIDVNSGKATKKHSIEETALHTNLEAAKEVARQLKLRDLSGLIVIDFIDMEDHRNNRTIERKLKEALKADKAKIQVGRISPFGLMEMSRQRIRASMLEATTQICPACKGIGHIRSNSSTSLEILRSIEEMLTKNPKCNLTVKVKTSSLIYMINNKRENINELETRFQTKIYITADNRIANVCEIEIGEPDSKNGSAKNNEPISSAPEKSEKLNSPKSRTRKPTNKTKKTTRKSAAKNEDKKKQSEKQSEEIETTKQDDEENENKQAWWKGNFF